jgi:hypothetical protein
MPPESLVIQATLQRPHREHSAASSLNKLLWRLPQTALGQAATLAATVFFFSILRNAMLQKIIWE